MKNYIYPAVFVKDEKDDVYRVIFPDLELTTDGSIVEEAYLYARECLKLYFVYVNKYDLDFNQPTDFEKIKKSAGANDYVLLVDAVVTEKDLKKKA